MHTIDVWPQRSAMINLVFTFLAFLHYFELGATKTPKLSPQYDNSRILPDTSDTSVTTVTSDTSDILCSSIFFIIMCNTNVSCIIVELFKTKIAKKVQNPASLHKFSG